eukprot:TRINITY_DN3368_c0_g3_i1.p2 TRINITY_DN3368_c0_g3~~TRINITY_DN3368_c0_g3_i1.p2  ORF type:complete len:225 (+),score=66.41 TRINITY_DN3368_c0_g3_i1:75-749(+)
MPVRPRVPRDQDGAVMEKIRLARERKEAAASPPPMSSCGGGGCCPPPVAVKPVEEEEEDKEPEPVTQGEWIFNVIFALICSSLPASNDPPDYVTAGVVLAVNVPLNLFAFSACWLDRACLYMINILVASSGDYIHRLNELPGKMEPLQWGVFLTSNALMLGLFYWYYLRFAESRTDKEWRMNVVCLALIVANTAAGLASGAVSWMHVAHVLKTLWNVVVNWRVR